MRPPEFTGGNGKVGEHGRRRMRAAFNEAAGIHRRKLEVPGENVLRHVPASMRPPEFTGGNLKYQEKTSFVMYPLQ